MLSFKANQEFERNENVLLSKYENFFEAYSKLMKFLNLRLNFKNSPFQTLMQGSFRIYVHAPTRDFKLISVHQFVFYNVLIFFSSFDFFPLENFFLSYCKHLRQINQLEYLVSLDPFRFFFSLLDLERRKRIFFFHVLRRENTGVKMS